jgi:hypothetical protein
MQELLALMAISGNRAFCKSNAKRIRLVISPLLQFAPAAREKHAPRPAISSMRFAAYKSPLLEKAQDGGHCVGI